MSRESRKAETAALLARIEAVVSGHDQQHSGEPAPGDSPLLLMQLREASAMRQLVPLVQRVAVVMEDFSRRVGLTGSAFVAFMEQLVETQKLPPVPAKAAHRRKYSR